MTILGKLIGFYVRAPCALRRSQLRSQRMVGDHILILGLRVLQLRSLFSVSIPLITQTRER